MFWVRYGLEGGLVGVGGRRGGGGAGWVWKEMGERARVDEVLRTSSASRSIMASIAIRTSFVAIPLPRCSSRTASMAI